MMHESLMMLAERQAGLIVLREQVCIQTSDGVWDPKAAPPH